MLEKTVVRARRASNLQRYAPLLPLVFASASFILTLLVVIPGSRHGTLENFHLITVNTSNIGAEAIRFTPITTRATSVQLAFSERSKRNTRPSLVAGSTAGTNTPTVLLRGYVNSTSMVNATIDGNPSSTLASGLSVTATSPASVASATTPANEPFASIIQSLTSGFESALAAAEGDIGALIQGLVQNVAGSIESELENGEGELRQFFDNIFQNLTAVFKHGSSTGVGSLIGGIIANLTSGVGLSLAGSGNGLAGLFSSVVGNFTADLDVGLSKAEDGVAEGITKALGIEEFYSIHLREVCAGTFSDSNAKFNISGCYPYSEAAPGLARLISNIPSSTTVLGTNISIPAITQVQEMSIFLANLTNTLDRTMFAFYIISLVGSGWIVVGSLIQLIVPWSSRVMYTNMCASTIGTLFSLSASATTTAFITTANSIINLFGAALGLQTTLGTDFLILTWISFTVSLLETCSLLAIWFIEFRTVSVKVQQRSPQENPRNWRGFGTFDDSKGGFVDSVGEVTGDRDIQEATTNTTRRLSSRYIRNSSKVTNF
ncbi:hypothetical protein EG329_000573 [Mollisiaceae sp. DMI_Dod_QoI]|nr:hypothetical protein EG329_000573 [Helotiales sp. DMI_Dod_QoI]